jgi:hypothetical protein
MAKLERWGKPYKDTRNWPEYNEQLVRRGTLYLSLEFVEQWDQLVGDLNWGKRGHPFHYPGQFIAWMACVHSIFQMPYRQMEGFTLALSKVLPGLQSADYTTLFRRIQRMPLVLPEIHEQSEDLVVAVDSTGIKVTNRGEWMREMWRVHRGWIKAHIIVDVKSKNLLGIEITNEKVSDGEVFPALLDQAQQVSRNRPVTTVLADGAYDHKDIFNRLEKDHINSGIKIRENAATKSGGSPYRAECSREKQKLGYRTWADENNYGQRWAVEGVYSSVKRIFGENVRASSFDGMTREVLMKFMFYQMIVNFGKGVT